MQRWLLFGVLIVLVPGVSSAATWCVPEARAGEGCQAVSGTIQGAIDAGMPGDIIRVGPGNPPERIVVNKRVRIVGVPGHLITDAGPESELEESDDPLISFSGTFQAPSFERLVLDVVKSYAGIVVPSTVGNIQFKGLQITSTVGRPPEGEPCVIACRGLQVNGNTRMYFVAASDLPARVAGFEVGIELNNVTWHDVEGGTVIENNGVGLRVIHGKGQIFWNTFHNNGIGLEARGIFHTDTNNNDFILNGVGLVWGPANEEHPDTGLKVSRQTEFDHNDFIVDDQQVAFQIEDPGCAGRWNNNEVNNAALPWFKTPAC